MSEKPQSPPGGGPLEDGRRRTSVSRSFQEEVRELVGYLSDAYPPAMVASAVAELVTASPELTCETIVSWANNQLYASSHSTPVSDFLYHTLKKLDLLDELDLAERDDYAAAFDQVTALVRQFVPAEELEGFDHSLTMLRDALETTTVGGVELIYRPRGASVSGAGAGGGEGSGGGGGGG
ncbi:MAG TPA: hypothetical protein VMT85_24765, partial [Thermoanaerobaculia bacterium]|nr:hypothetical protein [Thermoanaerobaculia bacterium]